VGWSFIAGVSILSTGIVELLLVAALLLGVETSAGVFFGGRLFLVGGAFLIWILSPEQRGFPWSFQRTKDVVDDGGLIDHGRNDALPLV